ncbi:MAG TPA: hypothetical protein VM307_14125 [Egibacteraceae bacterium]|nr:hypothetical protein [Egibacteraceae bacterium]
MEPAIFFALLAAGAVSVASLVVRFRRSAGVGRRQLKWLALGSVGAFAGVLMTFGPELLLWPALTLLLSLPASMGVAILRYRLFEIDRLISRTLSYLALTGVLAAVYAVGVVVLRPVIGRVAGDSTLAIAMSTLGVAALFGPARRRIQATVDRRFNRAQYDAARVAESFSTRLREQLDIEQLESELVGVVAQTVQPSGVLLWLRR